MRIDSTAQNSVDPKRAEERSERARVKEAEELAYALKSRGGAQKAFGGSEPMRLSVAHNLQPQLAKARVCRLSGLCSTRRSIAIRPALYLTT